MVMPVAVQAPPGRPHQIDAEIAEDDIDDAAINEEDHSEQSDDTLLHALDPPLPTLMGPEDPLRMKLTREEHAWAWDIKDCIEMLDDLDNLCDFWYAQLAIVCQDNVEDAVRRAYGLQYFREEFKIRDTFEQGRHCMHQLVL